MATETTQALDAFAGYDQGVFLDWLEGLTDLIQCGGDPGQLDKRSMAVVGGLMFSLVQAAAELGQRERAAERAKVKS